MLVGKVNVYVSREGEHTQVILQNMIEPMPLARSDVAA